jgi:UDP-N-acetylmuramate--alanine ligase
MSGPWSARRLHFVGVGGAGMSGYARAAGALGAQLSGSDSADSPYLERLRADGVLRAHIGHEAANVPAGGEVEVIYSSAVPAENPERRVARERGLRERPRAELLGEFTALKRTIAVAGTHGKTTTAAMLVHALGCGGPAADVRSPSRREATAGAGAAARGAGHGASGAGPDTDLSWLVGGSVGGGLPNAHWGAGEWLVVEADESDRSMLSLDVEIAVLSNVELDHHATYGSLRELREAFRVFLARARRGIVVWERPELLELTRRPPAARPASGGEPADVEVVPYDLPAPLPTGDRSQIGQRFQWRGREVRLQVPGAHNALNATAALEAVRLAGGDPSAAIAGLDGFRGAGRRFQMLGRGPGGALVYDDYAHHPTEVAATLSAARTLEHGRLVAVFQPHLYSRTALLAGEFGRALALADVVAVLDVYPARERAADHPGVDGLLIAQATADHAAGRAVYWLPTIADAAPVLRAVLGAGDLCVVMGAGDVDALGRRLVVDGRA